MPASWTFVSTAADCVNAAAHITTAEFVRVTMIGAGFVAGTFEPRWNTFMFPGSPAVSLASPPATAGTSTPSYVTEIACVTPVFAFVQTQTVTPRGVPPGVWSHVKEPSPEDPVVPVCDSELPMLATAI